MTNEDASEHSHNAALAISSTWPIRPSGTAKTDNSQAVHTLDLTYQARILHASVTAAFPGSLDQISTPEVASPTS